jgi:hypothetical protein
VARDPAGHEKEHAAMLAAHLSSRRLSVTAAAIVGLLLLASAGSAFAGPGGGGKGGGGGGGGKRADTTAPSVSITAPSSATLAGSVVLSGSAADNVQVASVDLSVDGGAYQHASGTTSWTASVDTTAYVDGSHVLVARATDSAGNTATASLSVTFRNATVSQDTTPPSVAIALPSAGASVSGAVSISGSATDNVIVAKVEISVDGGTYRAAEGTAAWDYALDTTSLSNGGHTVAARATDASGNVSSTNEAISVQNEMSLGSPVAAPPVSPGTVGGYAFQDLNRNGVYESGEQPLANEHLFLYDGSGMYLGNAYSDATGWYQFGGLPDGAYRVQFAPASWWAIRADWVPDTTGSLLAVRNVQLTGSARVDFGWRAIVRSTDASAPFSSYQGPNGLQVKSYDDVVMAKDIYDRLMSGSLVGPEAQFTTIRFDFTSTGTTSIMAGQTNGVYTSFDATSNVSYVSWLDGDGELFHEYGHAWSYYNAYIVQQDPTFTAYLRARGLIDDLRVGTSYSWDPREMIAEDYRQLFGTPSAQALTQMNRDIPAAKDVVGLKDFLAATFTTPPTG